MKTKFRTNIVELAVRITTIAMILLTLGVASCTPTPVFAKSTDSTCGKVTNDFMAKNPAFTLPILITALNQGTTIVCVAQFEEDNVDYSSPAILRFTYNVRKKSYKIRNIGGF